MNRRQLFKRAALGAAAIAIAPLLPVEPKVVTPEVLAPLITPPVPLPFVGANWPYWTSGNGYEYQVYTTGSSSSNSDLNTWLDSTWTTGTAHAQSFGKGGVTL